MGFVLVTSLSTSPEVAQSMIVDFVRATVGSSVFALTIQWGACIVFGTTGVFDTSLDQLIQKEEVKITNLSKKIPKLSKQKILNDLTLMKPPTESNKAKTRAIEETCW